MYFLQRSNLFPNSSYHFLRAYGDTHPLISRMQTIATKSRCMGWSAVIFVAFIAFYCILITAGVVTDLLGRNGQYPCYTVLMEFLISKTIFICLYKDALRNKYYITPNVRPTVMSGLHKGRLQLKCDGTRWHWEGKWRGNWRMEWWVASTLHTTSEHGVSSINTADAHTSAASSR
jgi:hypothetical protein